MSRPSRGAVCRLLLAAVGVGAVRVIMFGDINPKALALIAPTDVALAAQVVTGHDPQAGLTLCDRLHARGDTVSVRAVVEIASPSRRVTAEGFDRIADCVTTWHEIHSADVA